jgi:hypothetical protein
LFYRFTGHSGVAQGQELYQQEPVLQPDYPEETFPRMEQKWRQTETIQRDLILPAEQPENKKLTNDDSDNYCTDILRNSETL